MKLKFFLPFLAVMAISSAFISCSEDDDNKGNAVVYSTDALMLENFILDGIEPTITRTSVEGRFP